MRIYIIKRILLIIPTLIGITIITFIITRAVPGGPIEQVLSELRFSENNTYQSDNLSREGLTESDLLYLKKLYGFDKPVLVAYFQWLIKIICFDLGESYRYHEPVADLIIERLPVSLYYGLLTTIFTYLACIPLGVLKAIKNKTWLDSFTSIIIFAGYSIPAFVLGIILITYVAGVLEWFPLQGFTSDDFDEFSFFQKIWDIFYHSILPLICYMIGSFATMTILVKNALLENLSADYVKTALAKGLNRRVVLFKHALLNSLTPLAASFGNNIGLVLSGSYLIETIFGIDGLGLLGFESIQARDYPVVLGTLFVSTLLFLVGNILSDICLAKLDPRIRF